jgi:hypothetical protein
MDNELISHKEIIDRLGNVEKKVDEVYAETRTMVDAFKAVDGAFTVLGWLAKVAKPLLWIGGIITAMSILYAQLKIKL